MVTIEENHELLDIILGYKPDNYVPTYIETVFVNNTGTHIDFTLTSPNGDVFTEIKTYYLSDEGDWVWSASAEGYITKTDTITVTKSGYGNVITISIALDPEEGEVRVYGQGKTVTYNQSSSSYVYNVISRANIEHNKYQGSSYILHSNKILQNGSYLYYDNFQSSYKNIYQLDGFKTLNYYYKTNNVSEINLDTIYLVDSSLIAEGWFVFKLVDELTGNLPTGRFYYRILDDWGKQDDIFADLSKISDGSWVNVESGSNTAVHLPHTGYFTVMIWGDYYDETFVNVWCPNIGEERTVYVTPRYSADGLRAILSWGSDPNDLDSHLLIYNSGGSQISHVYYSGKEYYENGVLIASLDLDDTDGYGPETTTIYQLREGYMYYFYIYNYSSSSKVPTNAKVELKDGNRLVAVVVPPEEVSDGTSGRYWEVFSYSADTKEIKIKNKLVGYQPTKENWEDV